MSRTLAIAAGGGGDAITAAVLARSLGLEPVVMTYSRDRLIVDPLPGPRARDEFEGLHELAPTAWEVLPSSAVQPPGHSSLPQLADALPARLLLLDPSHGAAGMADQISAAADHFHADDLAVVDVGGDAVAEGHEQELRSPLADFLALAAACRTGMPVQLLVTGIPLDAELTEEQVLARLQQLDATEAYQLTADDFADLQPLFHWHPSEANGLLAAAARGIRGVVATRDHGGDVILADKSSVVFAVDGHRALKASSAERLVATTTLDDVENIVRSFHGTSEIDYERQKAGSRGAATMPDNEALRKIDALADAAANQRIDYLSVRRLAEQVGATDAEAMAELRRLLARTRPDKYVPPLYCTPSANDTAIVVRRLNPSEPRQFTQGGREVDFFLFVYCSDRGQHVPVLLTTARRELDGTHGMNNALRSFAPPMFDAEPDRPMSRESYSFRCPRCRRTPRINAAKWWSIVEDCGRAGLTELDISLLP